MKFLLSVFLFIASLTAGPLFDKFNTDQRPLIESFAKQNFENVTGHVFYPFGGPDITYPLLMFPNLDSITLIGLEPAKIINHFPIKLDNYSLSNLSSLYKRSFFITDQMAKSNINVTALILKQIENMNGADVSVSSYDDRKNAVVITFTYNGKKRQARFIKASLDNKDINFDLLKVIGPLDVVLFKAASYLPHQKSFSKFKDFILENSRMIVQDSTGIPYKDLKDKFDLNLHGRYLEPYKFPGGFEQTDYRCYSESLNKDELSFCFGYGCRFVPTNVLIAQSKSALSVPLPTL